MLRSMNQFAVTFALLSALPMCAQEARKRQPENTMGVMSEEVVRQRLQMLGHKEISSLTALNDKYQALTLYNGKKILIEVDGISGEIKEKRAGGDKSLPR